MTDIIKESKGKVNIYMSRDLTPMEIYYLNMSHFNDFGRYMYEEPVDLKYKNTDGTEHIKKDIYNTKQSIELAKSYPYVIACGAEEILKDISDKAKEYFETQLKNIIENNTHADWFVRKWVHGQLDGSFYYSEYNNQLLQEYLTDFTPSRQKNKSELER